MAAWIKHVKDTLFACSPSFLSFLIMKRLAFIILLLLFSNTASALESRFLYTLADFTDSLPFGGGRIFVDKNQNETYVIYQNIVHIFHKNGLLTYSFNTENELGQISGGGVTEDGTIYLLSHDWNTGEYGVLQCDYRGKLKKKIQITGVDWNNEDFSPTRFVLQNNQFFLADSRTMRVVVTDLEGRLLRSVDVFGSIEFEEKIKRIDNEFGGFWADKDGKMYFTIPSQFMAGIVSIDNKVKGFGQPGDLPGKFNIVGGITTDEKGNIFIIDKLKCSIQIFDKDTNFVSAFGERGKEEENLINPDDLVVDAEGKVFVAQGAKRGLNVYLLHY